MQLSEYILVVLDFVEDKDLFQLGFCPCNIRRIGLRVAKDAP